MLEITKNYYFQRKGNVDKAIKCIIANSIVYTHAI